AGISHPAVALTYQHVVTAVYSYDGLSRLTATTDGAGADRRTSTTAYDPGGRATRVTDPNRNQTVTGDDPLDRVTSTTRGANDPAVSSTTTSSYDAAGNRTGETTGISDRTVSLTYQKLGTTVYSYDSLNRLTSTTAGAGSPVATTATVQYDRAD